MAPRLRFAIDTGGTFTDLVVEGSPGGLRFYKRPTTPDDPLVGVRGVLDAAAADLSLSRGRLLAQADFLIFGTTRATNAVVTHSTAKTALLVTEGHPDVLLFREGGDRVTLFDYTQEYPEPFIPRSLTFEIPERMGAQGEVVVPLDEGAVVRLTSVLRDLEVEAVAVSLLWSIVNPDHELRVGELLESHLPGRPYTLSHRLNPSIREYRRSSSAAIDASLKPLMAQFFRELEERLAAEGFGGRLLIMTSAGGVLDPASVAEAPIHSINSGPAAAPVAGRHFARLDLQTETSIVTDAGGTTFDVSLVRRGQVPWTRETKLGHPVYGYLTGFPSADVRSIGAGGGSIAWVDEGGLLRVGPESAAAEPGPACYGRGGDRATVTDACLVLGYLDSEYFLGGEMTLVPALAAEAVRRDVADPLSLDLHEAAAAVLELTVDQMARAIEEIALGQGIEPASVLTVAGGGGAGLYAAGIARRLGSARVIIPEVAAALSATGALLSDLRAHAAVTAVTTTAGFDFDAVNAALASLGAAYDDFVDQAGADARDAELALSVEARYPDQVWEIEVPVRVTRFGHAREVEQLRQDFHATHEEIFAVSDPESAVECVAWRAHMSCSLGSAKPVTRPRAAPARWIGERVAYFRTLGLHSTRVLHLDSLEPGERVFGPAIVESPATTVVVDPGAEVERLPSGSLLLVPAAGGVRGVNREAEVGTAS